MHGTLMDRTRPLWEANLIEGLADGRVALYVKVHHAMMDGVAAMRLLQAVLSEDPAESRPPIWAQERKRRLRTTSDEAPRGWFERALAAAEEIVPGVGSGIRELVRAQDADSVEAQPFHAPPTMFNVRISGSRRFAAQSYALSRFKTLGKAAGATVNDITLAICSGALRRYLLARDALPERPLIAMVPVSVRPAEGEVSGNQIALMLANLATHVEDPRTRLDLIVESTRVAKDRLSKMSRLERVAHAAAMSAPMGPSMIIGFAKRRPIYNVVISNVPGPTETLYLDGMRLEENCPVSIPVEYLALNITMAGYAGQLGFGFIACRRSVPQLQRMLDHTSESLDELEAVLASS
jgi:diacylglycerol O-acyltransferase